MEKKLIINVKGQTNRHRYKMYSAVGCEQNQNPFMHGLSLDCSTALSQIKSLKIVKKVGDTSGSWFKDPSEGSAKVCSFQR